ncbi:hypothetical protein ACQEU6_46240 [Spirillospora sp. CA-108201]
MRRITSHEWENELMPPRPRTRAVVSLLPEPSVLAMAAVGSAAVVAGLDWLLVLAIAVGVYGQVFLSLCDRFGTSCETVDHWVGEGEMPGGMTHSCPDCRDIPWRVLWRRGGGR